MTETPFKLGSKGWIYSPSLALDGLPLFLACFLGASSIARGGAMGHLHTPSLDC